MWNESKKLHFFSITYLLFPNILFVAGWFKLQIAIPAICVLLFVWVSLIKEHISETPVFTTKKLSYKQHVILVILALAICLFSGIGGFVFQGDFIKHQAMLHDLVYNEWPVVYEQSGVQNSKKFLNYYFAFFLPPALLAKIIDPTYIDNLMILWAGLGLYLTFRWVIYFLGNRNIWLPLCFLLFLGGQDFFYAFLKWGVNSFLNDALQARQIFKQEIATVCVFHNTLLRYPTNFFAISWAPQHLIGAWLATSLLVENYRKKTSKKHILFISSLLPLWSVFNTVGLIPILSACILQNRKHLFSWQNLLGGGLLIFLTSIFYLAHNKLNTQGWLWEYLSFKLIAIKLPLFLIFEVGYIALLIKRAIVKSYWKNLYYTCLIFLSVLPLYVLGYMNDLLMRAAVPSLFVINLMAYYYFDALKFRYKKLVLGIIFLGVIFPQIITISSHFPQLINFHLQNGFANSRNRVKDAKSIHELTIEEWFNLQYFGDTESVYFKYFAK